MSSQCIFDKVVAIDGEPAMAPSPLNTNAKVWVPGIGNGAFQQLLKELLARGWAILPPEAKTEIFREAFGAGYEAGNQAGAVAPYALIPGDKERGFEDWLRCQSQKNA